MSGTRRVYLHFLENVDSFQLFDGIVRNPQLFQRFTRSRPLDLGVHVQNADAAVFVRFEVSPEDIAQLARQRTALGAAAIAVD